MLDKSVKKDIHERLCKARKFLYENYPFFGFLLMHLKFELEEGCGTAYTDMKKLVFDPAFAMRLKDEELQFVLNHEVLHIALKHCIRGKGLNQEIYNCACDIYVNSYLMQMLEVKNFYVDGQEVIHLAPDGQEGYLFDAETLYKMLLSERNSTLQKAPSQKRFDSHDAWEKLETYSALNDKWSSYIKDAVIKRISQTSKFPLELLEWIKNVDHKPMISWKTELLNFIKMAEAKPDYNFRPPERRCGQWDVILPGLNDADAHAYEDLLFFFDVSGSISNREAAIFFEEIKNALKQVQGLKGKLFFFDTRVSDPVPLENLRSMKKVKPMGGGTSFHAIFDYIHKRVKGKLPPAIIILTDGWAQFPPKAAAKGIPVLWVMTDSTIKAPWGKTIYIK